MNEDKLVFLRALLEYEVLQFGDFVTKSGRQSPYFFNTGNFNSAKSMDIVAQCYASLIHGTWGGKAIHLYGPAYKGIPLSVMVADRIYRQTGNDAYFTFNRKEIKDHGEGGFFVGCALRKDRPVIVIEDVLTGGTSLRETHQLLKESGVSVQGVIVGVDREEKGSGQSLAKQEIESLYDAPVMSILTLSEIKAILTKEKFLGKRWISPTCALKMQAYQENYGVI